MRVVTIKTTANIIQTLNIMIGNKSSHLVVIAVSCSCHKNDWHNLQEACFCGWLNSGLSFGSMLNIACIQLVLKVHCDLFINYCWYRVLTLDLFKIMFYLWQFLLFDLWLYSWPQLWVVITKDCEVTPPCIVINVFDITVSACSDFHLSFVNSMTIPLIMYSK